MANIRITNTLTNKLEVIEPRKDSQITMYVCGVTPYDYAHIGHGRCYVVFDVFLRLLRFLDYDVVYCRNFTDIDDKILDRAARELGDRNRYKEISEKYIEAFKNDMQDLGCISPTYEPRVTETIDEIIAFIDGLIKSGHAYVSDGDVYYSIKSFPDYGKLSKRKLDDMIAGARVSVTEKKRDPLDFALWKAEPEGEFWKSPWGYGRPGWHIECSAMARTLLGDRIDVHGGGMDLIFPHHENEIAQSEPLVGNPFSAYWMHIAFVRVDQEKMSKSLGNFMTLHELFKTVDPMVVRYMYLQHQYRNPLDFSLNEIESLTKSYSRLVRLFEGAEVLPRGSLKPSNLSPVTLKMLDFLLDDLNTPGMFGVVFENFNQINENQLLKSETKSFLSEVLGLNFIPLPEKKIEITDEMSQLVKEREEAREQKDWARADQIRDRLRTLGFEVSDKKI